jgi:hypothetical protein
MRFATVCVSLLCGVTPLAAQSPASAIDWDSLGAEAVRNLSAYLAVNTANPPGNELAAARFLQQLLAKDGIEAQILDTAELGPGRANLYARYHSSSGKKAIALVNHMDVVPVTPQFWSVDPFSGVAFRSIATSCSSEMPMRRSAATAPWCSRNVTPTGCETWSF